MQLSLTLLACLALCCGHAPAAGRPNIIYILADDLGYGDLGCYGQRDIRTPNLDRMAREGLRFTRHYSGASVCAPSRSCLLTGLHTGHTPIRGNQEVFPEGQAPLPEGTLTVASLLKGAGYVTGAFGKWGLGFPGSSGSPLRQGFDTFFGYNCQRLAHSYYPYHLRSGDDLFPLPGNAGDRREQYAPDIIQERTLAFMEEHREKPFFLFVAHVAPHAELVAPDDEILRSYRGRFKETPYEGIDSGPQFRIGGYASAAEPRATYAAMVTRLDLHVGQILDKLKALGLDDRTLVLFTSDNGPHDEGGIKPSDFGSSGGLRGQKRDLYEGGLRVPFIARWPGHIAPGSESGLVCAFWDMMPTLAEVAGTPVPGKSDGLSILPTLLGQADIQRQHESLYWEFHEQGGKQAVLQGRWKAIRLQVGKTPDGPLALYDLENDPGETRDIAHLHPDKARELAALMDKSRTPSPEFNFRQGTYSGKMPSGQEPQRLPQ